MWLLDLQPGPLEPAARKAKRQRKRVEAAVRQERHRCRAGRAHAAPKPGDGAPAFDIARIDPNGTSVFAGRAEPNSAVTITADGKEIGTAQANENGEWTFTTDEKIANPDAKLALFKAPPGTAARVAEPLQRAPDVKPQAPPGPDSRSRPKPSRRT